MNRIEISTRNQTIENITEFCTSEDYSCVKFSQRHDDKDTSSEKKQEHCNWRKLCVCVCSLEQLFFRNHRKKSKVRFFVSAQFIANYKQ